MVVSLRSLRHRLERRIVFNFEIFDDVCYENRSQLSHYDQCGTTTDNVICHRIGIKNFIERVLGLIFRNFKNECVRFYSLFSSVICSMLYQLSRTFMTMFVM